MGSSTVWHDWHRRWNVQHRCLLFALLLAAAVMAGCAASRESSAPSMPSGEPTADQVVATIAQTEPGDALRQYLHGWMLRYNEQAPGEQQSASDVRWVPETPDDFVSVMPAVSMTDFETVTAWSASIQPLGSPSESQASYRADFMFWRGNPLSSAGTGAVPLSSTATYDLTWDDAAHTWTITLTSKPPEDCLVESSDEGTAGP